MAAESPVWDQIRSTLPDSYDTEIAARFGGMLKRRDLHWVVSGPGSGGNHYAMNVTEYRPHGRVAEVFEPDISLIAIIGKYMPRRGDQSPTHTVYLASLEAGEVTDTSGRVYDLDNLGDTPPVRPLWIPPTMPPEEALAGVEQALADVRFN